MPSSPLLGCLPPYLASWERNFIWSCLSVRCAYVCWTEQAWVSTTATPWSLPTSPYHDSHTDSDCDAPLWEPIRTPGCLCSPESPTPSGPTSEGLCSPACFRVTSRVYQTPETQVPSRAGSLPYLLLPGHLCCSSAFSLSITEA